MPQQKVGFKVHLTKVLSTLFIDLNICFIVVQLWYCSNYHWFLKQELDFPVSSSCDAINALYWDAECSLKLHVLTKGICQHSSLKANLSGHPFPP